MDQTARLPLFPLPMTACPSEIVPLHIFEERYKAMIHACQQSQAVGGLGEFVLVYQAGANRAEVGTSLRLSSVLQAYANGSMDILATGTRRCRILREFQDQPYGEAEVQWVCDGHSDWTESLATEAFQLHQTLLQMSTGHTPPDSFYSGKFLLSFALMASLGLPTEEKQALLELDNEDERLGQVIGHMKRAIRILETARGFQEAVQSWWNLNRVVRKWKTSSPS